MTDDQGAPPPSEPSPWIVPGAVPTAGPQPIPGWQQQQQSTPGWTPPPKPGLIPLRPLSFGTILGSSFRVMRRNPAPTFGLAVLLYGFITVVFFVVFGALTGLLFSRFTSASYDDQNDILAGSVALMIVALIVPMSLAVVATAILQGIISLEVARATLGEKLRVRGLWRLAKGRVAPLVGWALLLTAAVVVFVLVASVVMVVAFTAAGTAGSNGSLLVVLGAVFVVIVLGLGFIVLGAWLGTKLSLVPSIIMLERLTLKDSVARSWSLTRNNFWRTLGIQLLINVIVSTASSVITTPVSVIGQMVALVVNPNADSGAAIATIVVVYIITGVVSIVGGAIGLVMQSAAVALIYIDIRMRKEGLDLELLRYVEAKQSGTPGVDNPYLRLQNSATAPSTPPAAGSPWA